MSFGSGYGESFGGTGVEPVTSPASVVNGGPISFEFSDEGNNPLPGPWAFLVLADDGFGNKSTTAETVAEAPQRFRVVEGVAGWFYRRAPSLPGPGVAYEEHGALASPQSILTGRNGEVAVVFRAPPLVQDETADEFKFELLIGLRASADLTTYVGGRVRAEWAAGVWTTPLAVEAVSAAGLAPVVLATAPLPDIPDLIDVWDSTPTHELKVTVRNGALSVELDGHILATAAIPDNASVTPFILVRAWNRKGATLDPVASLLGIALRTLRDPARLGPPPQILGDIDLENPTLPRVHLPLEDMVAKGIFKRQGSRSFVATQDVNIDDVIAFETGDVVRATEPYEGQLLTVCVVDLAQLRAERRGAR